MENLKPHLFRFDSAGSTMSWQQSFESWEMTSGKWVWNFLKTISCIFLFALSPVVPATSLSPGYSASRPARPPVHSPLGGESELYKTLVTSWSWPLWDLQQLIRRFWWDPVSFHPLIVLQDRVPLSSSISSLVTVPFPLMRQPHGPCPPSFHRACLTLSRRPFHSPPRQTCLSFRPLLQ